MEKQVIFIRIELIFLKFNSVNLVKFMPNLAVYGNSNIVVSVSSKTLDKNKIMYEKRQ